ncbi:MAG: hypothetical protein V3V01_05605 [Acidimicrobiales bacterium]
MTSIERADPAAIASGTNDLTDSEALVDAPVSGVDSVETVPASSIEEGFSKSIFVSAVRCLLTYVIFPFVTPFYGFASSIGPWVGVTLGTFAIFANLFSIRRFWRAQHKWRRPVTVVHVGIIVLLVVLVVVDLGELFT